jgi:hypothetical protein
MRVFTGTLTWSMAARATRWMMPSWAAGMMTVNAQGIDDETTG